MPAIRALEEPSEDGGEGLQAGQDEDEHPHYLHYEEFLGAVFGGGTFKLTGRGCAPV